jgi:hypothetical protein
MRRSILLLLCLVLAACGASSATPPATPSVDASPADFRLEDALPIVLGPGDLPPGYLVYEQLFDYDMFRSALHTDDTLSADLYRWVRRDVVGHVTILRYAPEYSDEAYEVISKGIANEGDIGEHAVMGYGTDTAQIAFVRCHTVVYIIVSGVPAARAKKYAQNLDKRLQRLVCQ